MGAIVLLRSARSSENCTGAPLAKDLPRVKGAHSRAPVGEAGVRLARTPLATSEVVLLMAQAPAAPGHTASARRATPSARVAARAHLPRVTSVCSFSHGAFYRPRVRQT